MGWKRRVAAGPSAGQLALVARPEGSPRGGHRQSAAMPQARKGGQWDRVWAVLKVLAGLALLILSVRNIDWRSLPGSLAAARPGWLTLALLTVLLGLALRILRWRVLLDLADDVPALPAVSEAYLAGKAANTLMPFHGGEVIRLGLLAAQTRISLTSATLSVVTEKVLDLLALAGLTLILLPSLPASITAIVPGWLLLAAGAVGGLLAVGLLGTPTLCRWIRPRLVHVSGARQGLVRVLDEIAFAVLALRRPAVAIPAVGLTICAWGAMTATNAVLFKAMGMPLGAEAAGLVMLLVMIGLLPAVMPGNIGPFYFFARLALVPFHVDPQLAIAYVIVLHLIVTLPPVLGGGLLLIVRRRGLVSSS